MSRHSPSSILLAMVLCVPIVCGHGALAAALAADCGSGVGPCSCGDRVVTNTKLTGSDPVLRTTCPCDGIIVSSGVALDIGGTIRGGGNACTGVLIEDGANDVIVRHGRVTGFGFGVVGGGDRAKGLTVTGVQSVDNGAIGIALGGTDVVVTENIVRGSESFGIFVVGDGVIQVRNNRADGNGNGISVISATPTGTVIVSRNVAIRNAGRGIEVNGFGTTTVELNRAELNGGLGVYVSDNNVAVLGNVSTSNGLDATAYLRDGFFLECIHCRVDGNRSFYNGGFGIVDSRAVNNVGDDNVYTNNLCGGNALGDSAPPGLCR